MTPANGFVQRGLALHRAGDAAGASALYEQALALDPSCFDALQLLGLLRFRGGAVDTGIELLERALQIAPSHPSTLNNYGNALLAAGRWAEAAAAYQRAIAAAAKPAAVMFRNLGIALFEAGGPHADGAALALDRAIALDPADVEAINRRAGLAVQRRDWQQAEALYTRSLQLRPSVAVRLARLMARQNLAAWADWSTEVAAIADATPPAEEQVDPLKLMFLVDAPVVQRRFADAFAEFGRRRTYIPNAEDGKKAARQDARLSIGYLSYDIRRHPVAQLVAGVLEQHDRTRFEVTVHALGPNSLDPERQRIREACEHFENHEGRTEAQSITAIRDFRHDVLIDLMGYTRDARPAILLARPARLQIGWLGYPGTLGTGVLDALIADAVVIPEGAEADYAESVWRLPDCYLPADRTRRVNPPRSRADYGFADHEVIMACFCQLQKITPEVFDVWLAAMKEQPHLALWLFDAVPLAAKHLRERASRAGVAPERIRFAGFVDDHADHLARYAVADFAVDTYPYGSHTTAIDALWVGCPLVAHSGRGFASRVSGSVLRAAGLPELIAESSEEYRDQILRLAGERSYRDALRTRLLSSRDAIALFDVARFTRHYEKLLLDIAHRHWGDRAT